jgi:hypothetical protein
MAVAMMIFGLAVVITTIIILAIHFLVLAVAAEALMAMIHHQTITIMKY